MAKKQISDWVIIFMSAVIFMSVVYWAFCDMVDGKIYNPILEMGTRAKVFTHQTTKTAYRPGDMVYAHVMFHKNRNLVGIIQWHMINNQMTTFAPRNGSLPIGVYDQVVPVERIPDDVKPGEHWFTGTVVYRPNWIGIVEYPVWTNKFEVVAK